MIFCKFEIVKYFVFLSNSSIDKNLKCKNTAISQQNQMESPGEELFLNHVMQGGKRDWEFDTIVCEITQNPLRKKKGVLILKFLHYVTSYGYYPLDSP